jgi:hypothetical protein
MIVLGIVEVSWMWKVRLSSELTGDSPRHTHQRHRPDGLPPASRQPDQPVHIFRIIASPIIGSRTANGATVLTSAPTQRRITSSDRQAARSRVRIPPSGGFSIYSPRFSPADAAPVRTRSWLNRVPNARKRGGAGTMGLEEVIFFLDFLFMFSFGVWMGMGMTLATEVQAGLFTVSILGYGHWGGT